jgi:hypothetical protein
VTPCFDISRAARKSVSFAAIVISSVVATSAALTSDRSGAAAVATSIADTIPIGFESASSTITEWILYVAIIFTTSASEVWDRHVTTPIRIASCTRASSKGGPA